MASIIFLGWAAIAFIALRRYIRDLKQKAAANTAIAVVPVSPKASPTTVVSVQPTVTVSSPTQSMTISAVPVPTGIDLGTADIDTPAFLRSSGQTLGKFHAFVEATSAVLRQEKTKKEIATLRKIVRRDKAAQRAAARSAEQAANVQSLLSEASAHPSI